MSTTKGIPLTFPSWHDLNVSAVNEGADKENADGNRASSSSSSSSTSSSTSSSSIYNGTESSSSPEDSNSSSSSKVSMRECTCECVVVAKIQSLPIPPSSLLFLLSLFLIFYLAQCPFPSTYTTNSLFPPPPLPVLHHRRSESTPVSIAALSSFLPPSPPPPPPPPLALPLGNST